MLMAAVKETLPTPQTLPRVLLVEDDVVQGDIVEELLMETYNVSIVRAYNADEALEELRVQAFDLVFTDVMMPGSMNGVELAKHIRIENPSLPIIICTGNAPKRSLKDAERFPVLIKPYPFPQLKAALSRAGIHPAGTGQ